MATRRLTIITGGSRGLGRCLVQACLELGDVLNLSRQPASVARRGLAAGRHAAELHALHNLAVDLRHPAEAEQALAGWLAARPEQVVDAVIHNAACPSLGWLGELPAAELASAFSVNVFSPIALTARLLREGRFAPRGARIVYVISSLARHEAGLSFAGLGAYSATKAALSRLALIQSRELELTAPHLKVLRVHPGIVDTELQRELRQHPALDPAFGAKTAALPPYRPGDWLERSPDEAMRTISAELAAEFVLWALATPAPTSDEYDFYRAAPFHAARRQRALREPHA